MRIIVASALEAGSHLAHAINTIKMADGFSLLGHKVTILCKRNPGNPNMTSEELNQLYSINKDVDWKFLTSRIGSHYSFGLMGLIKTLTIQPDFVFSRNYVYPSLTARFGYATVAESHAHEDFLSRPFLSLIHASKSKNFRQLVTISKHLKEYYVTLGVPDNKCLVLPDSVDPQLFRRPDVLPPSPYSTPKYNISYIGHLYDYKGIPTILESAKRLPNVSFHLVGGMDEDIKKQEKKIKDMKLNNVIIHGMKPYNEVPKYLWHSDILLLPPSENHPSAKWTSPVKLAEYLISGTPVLATEIPALKDWVSDDTVTYVQPDNPEAMAEGIQFILNHPEEIRKKVDKGLSVSENWTYKNRAKSILDKSVR